MKTSRFIALAVVALAVVVVVGAGTGRADVAPPDSCTSPGQPCQNAGSQYNQAGTCVATTCTKSVPGPDGGLTPMSYACNLCRLPDGGTSSTGAGGSGAQKSSSGSGCSVAGSGGVPGALALLALALGRGRRRTSA